MSKLLKEQVIFMQSHMHFIDNNAGWQLAVKQVYDEKTLEKKRNPLVIVPGYGMNAFIFGYHPTDKSLEEYLVSNGFEVWSVNLRGQNPSCSTGGSKLYGMADVSLVDIPAAVDFALQNTKTDCDKVGLVGCSLGGSMVFTYLALTPSAPVSSIVALGSPLRWVRVHPILKAAFSFPRLLGMLPIGNARGIARAALPILSRLPKLLEIYMHPDNIDMSKASLFLETVEDPNRMLNREIGEWINAKDLTVDGRNISENFAGNKLPILCVIANADGIVPPETAKYPLDISASEKKDSFCVGDEDVKFAHADLYISNNSGPMFFKPLVDWLLSLPI